MDDYLQKVMWGEGMFLTPQHFQQQDRYHEQMLFRRSRALCYHHYGVTSLQINKEDLGDGKFGVLRAAGVLPDGTWFDIPGLDQAPFAQEIDAHYGPDDERLDVFLGLPLAEPGQVLCREGGVGDDRNTAYVMKVANLLDVNRDKNTGTADAKREVGLSTKDLRILFEDEVLDGYATIKVAEITRTATGDFELIDSYVPPSLYYSSSQHLVQVLRRTLERVSNKSETLAQQRRQRAAGLVEFSMADAGQFWLLHAVNSYVPVLNHMNNQGRVHPEEVYLHLVRLYGELHTFSDEGHPRDVPAYDHQNLGPLFDTLETEIARLLDTILPTKVKKIPLELDEEDIWRGRITDARILETPHTLVLACKTSAADETVVQHFPHLAKVSSPDWINYNIEKAIKGAGLRYLPVPPASIPVQPGQIYFAVEKSGDYWKAVENSKAIAIHAPPMNFPDLRLELMAVEE